MKMDMRERVIGKIERAMTWCTPYLDSCSPLSLSTTPPSKGCAYAVCTARDRGSAAVVKRQATGCSYVSGDLIAILTFSMDYLFF